MKAILVIDVPDKYSDRDIYALHEIYTYEGNRYERIEEYKEGVHKLKPLPRKKSFSIVRQGEIDVDVPIWFLEKVNNQGYNKCIDDLLGAENER